MLNREQHGHFRSCIKLNSYQAMGLRHCDALKVLQHFLQPLGINRLKLGPTGRAKLLKHSAHLVLLLGSQQRLLILRSLVNTASFVCLVIQEGEMASQGMLSYCVWLNFDHTVPAEDGTLLHLPFYHLIKLLQALTRSSSHAVQPHWPEICLVISQDTYGSFLGKYTGVTSQEN